MSTERMMIFKMVERGKITPAEAEVLFRALGDDEIDNNIDPLGMGASHQVETDLHGEMSHSDVVQHPNPQPDRSTFAPTPETTPAAQSIFGKIARILLKTPAPVKRDRRRHYPDPSYAVSMKQTGLDFSIDQLIRMHEEDIDPELAAKMVREMRPEWTTDDIVEMLTQGACPDVLSKLNELGFGKLSPHDVIQLTEYDIEPEYLERFRGISMTWMTAQDLIEFFDNDVDPDLAIALKEIGSVTTSAIVKASDNDLSPSSVRQIALVLPGITVPSLIELSDNDVSPDFIVTLVRGGFTNLSIKQIIKLQENDVDPVDAVWFRKNLGEHITVDDLLRLASNDIGRDYVKPLLKFNLPDLNADALIEMANHDVSAEDAAQARKIYGDAFTVADLINIAKNS
jgi:hypothetical protein